MCEEGERGRRGYRPKGAPKGAERGGSRADGRRGDGLSGREVPRRGDTKPEEESSRSLSSLHGRARVRARGNLSVAQRRGDGGDGREEDERDPARRRCRCICSFNPKQE